MQVIEYIREIFVKSWEVLNEMSPYLLFGFFVAGVLSVMIRQETVERHLGGRGILPITKAAAFGVPLPLCSCGVIPVAASLKKHGASKGSTISFLISTPQTGVDSIFVTYSLLGLVIAVFRPLAALVSGMIGGIAVSLFDKNGGSNADKSKVCTDDCCTNPGSRHLLYRVFYYGFVTLIRDIAKPLIVGLFIAGVISVFVPDDFFHGNLGSKLGQGFTGMLVMMAIGIPMYVCASASVPIAAALIAKGASPGAAIVFLMTGPATNAAAITTIWKIMGTKTAVIYLASVVICSFAGGFLLDRIVLSYPHVHNLMQHKMIPPYISITTSVILLVLLGVSLYQPWKSRHKKIRIQKGDAAMKPIALIIKGMTCSHCANAVKRAILESGGVSSADVNLASGTATITGKAYNLIAIGKSIEELGYKVEGRKSPD